MDARFKIFNWKEKENARLPNTYGARLYNELFSRTLHLIDSRQNGFLKNNSCEMNLNTLIESISTNLLQDFPTDIIYFDFAKAFDTVNHDLILSKLKYQYSIDGRMLKFFKSYLSN